jgi:phage baseplate assembly protein W
MAFGEKQIFPIDVNNSLAVGIDLPLNGPSVFKQNFQTKDAIKSSLINFLLTNPGERFLNPSFGAGLRDFLFTQITDNNLNFLKEDLQSKINRLFPNIRIDSLEVSKTNIDHLISVNFTYSIVNTDLTDDITLSFT